MYIQHVFVDVNGASSSLVRHTLCFSPLFCCILRRRAFRSLTRVPHLFLSTAIDNRTECLPQVACLLFGSLELRLATTVTTRTLFF